MAERNYVLTKEAVQQKLERMALEIAEQLSEDDKPIVLIGIKPHGLVVAEKLSVYLLKYIQVPVQIISVAYDKQLPVEMELSNHVHFTDKNIIITDDVINTGRTMLYALKPLLDFHPKRIQTLVLVERMHKLFPIKPDYVGVSVATTAQDHIAVDVDANGDITGAYVA